MLLATLEYGHRVYEGDALIIGIYFGMFALSRVSDLAPSLKSTVVLTAGTFAFAGVWFHIESDKLSYSTLHGLAHLCAAMTTGLIANSEKDTLSTKRHKSVRRNMVLQ